MADTALCLLFCTLHGICTTISLFYCHLQQLYQLSYMLEWFPVPYYSLAAGCSIDTDVAIFLKDISTENGSVEMRHIANIAKKSSLS